MDGSSLGHRNNKYLKGGETVETEVMNMVQQRWYRPQIREIDVRATQDGTVTKLGTGSDKISKETGLLGSNYSQSG